MSQYKLIDRDIVTSLIDYSSKGSISDDIVEKQVRGTVGIHNILVNKGIAYLADEVGMGKTYITLGTLAIFRYFNPTLRVLIIVPKENIQNKWLKDYINFVSINWRRSDLKIKSLQGKPIREVVLCRNLLDFARKIVLNRNRDFILRMSSFSFPLSDDENGESKHEWQKKYEEMKTIIPWLSEDELDYESKDKFKETYARALKRVLPQFDLIVIDEGHNLKHGPESNSSRNKLIHSMFGDNGHNAHARRLSKKTRVLILSATPLETDYRDIRNQFALFGKTTGIKKLNDDETSLEDKKKLTKSFLIRRLNSLKIGNKEHTKNMYRREWRMGGVKVPEEPIEEVDDKKQLIVGLVQKKVAEVLEAGHGHNSARFGRQFQMGMLASFESFLQTAKVNDVSFDQSDQTDVQAEKDGIDADSVNELANSYRKKFGKSLPHPKMDTVAEALGDHLEKGEKVLVFVRRIASVTELKEKVLVHYNKWLKRYITNSLPQKLRKEFNSIFKHYQTENKESYIKGFGKMPNKDETVDSSEEDERGFDSFFAWFFRGIGPKEIMSGSDLRKSRFDSEGSVLSIFFEDNYVSWLLDYPDDIVSKLKEVLDYSSRKKLVNDLSDRAYRKFIVQTIQRDKFPKRRVFLAYQEAALELIKTRGTADLGEKANCILQERFSYDPKTSDDDLKGNFPSPDEHLNSVILFSVLSSHKKYSDLRDALWPYHRIDDEQDFRKQFRERELQREFLISALSLGHPFIDIWILLAKKIGEGFSQPRKEGDKRSDLKSHAVQDFALTLLKVLERQKAEKGLNSYHELRRLMENYEQIINLNFHDIRDSALSELSKKLRLTFGKQTPVGGMFGKVNQTLIRQFRMPGYPYILITTDLVQEGEDLHTFSSRIMHYGITWTPSAMEQRIGRIDRIGSLTHRTLKGRDNITDDQKLQVYYPYLPDIVEFIQVNEIFKRMNTFIKLLHSGFGLQKLKESRVTVSADTLQDFNIEPPIEDELKTPFSVPKRLLNPPQHKKYSYEPETQMQDLETTFQKTIEQLGNVFFCEWTNEYRTWTRFGTVYVRKKKLIKVGEKTSGSRQQPFMITLKSARNLPVTLMVFHVPVGVMPLENKKINQLFKLFKAYRKVKFCGVEDEKFNSLNLFIQTEIIFDKKTTQIEEVISAFLRAIVSADEIEKRLLKLDQGMSEFIDDLKLKAD